MRTGSIVAAIVAAAAFACLQTAHAADARDVTFLGSRLDLPTATSAGDEVLVATDDPGLGRVLAQTGATLAYEPGQRYAIVTSGDRRTITFRIGDQTYSDGNERLGAGAAPVERAGKLYLPFYTLARALFLHPVPDGRSIVLQPQVGEIDVTTLDGITTVTIHGALPLSFRREDSAKDRMMLSFAGLGSALDPTRTIPSEAVRSIGVAVAGTPSAPSTTVTFVGAPLGPSILQPPTSSNVVQLAFASPGFAVHGRAVPVRYIASAAQVAQVELGPSEPAVAASPIPLPSAAVAPAEPLASAEPLATTAPPAAVRAVSVSRSGDAAIVDVAVDAPVRYRWHRLRDDRWYIDLIGAQLAMPAADEPPSPPGVTQVRVRQFARTPEPIVRIALSLDGLRDVAVSGAPDGIALRVGARRDKIALRTGEGELDASGALVAAAPAIGGGAARGAPAPPYAPAAPTNARVIAIDPGHGGDDPGSMHNGLVEKDLTLDISLRLAKILRTEGWTVDLTRSTDRAVVTPQALQWARSDGAPLPDDDAELQSRDDVANVAGARLFVSIHIDSYGVPSLNGTSVYYYKSVDRPLADEIHAHLAGELGTADLGIKRDKFYVLNHSTMPAVLVEVAFLSNPEDAARLRSPEFRERVATALASGIDAYAKQQSPASADQ